MEKLRIVGWTNFDSQYPSKPCTKEEMDEIILLIREEIIKNKYYFSGEEHQYSLTGVPVFSNGTCFRASMRCWGYLMSTIYLLDFRKILPFSIGLLIGTISSIKLIDYCFSKYKSETYSVILGLVISSVFLMLIKR